MESLLILHEQRTLPIIVFYILLWNKMLNKKQRILVLAPHTDDGEFGCGGTISKFINEGHDVYYAAFSACQQSVLPQFPSDILITEVKEATRVLGIKSSNLILIL